MQQLIFVFGTLKRDYPNFHYNQAQQVSAPFATARPYPLYLVGPCYVPWMIDQPGRGLIVRGEVYEADSKHLKLMDQLEEVDQPYGYQRKIITVKNLDNGKLSKVFAYMKRPQQLDPAQIRIGPLAEYQPEHARLYDFKNDRI